ASCWVEGEGGRGRLSESPTRSGTGRPGGLTQRTPVRDKPRRRERQEGAGDAGVGSQALASVWRMAPHDAEQSVEHPQTQVEQEQRPQQHSLDRAAML